jgi:hypothetical protein
VGIKLIEQRFDIKSGAVGHNDRADLMTGIESKLAMESSPSPPLNKN